MELIAVYQNVIEEQSAAAQAASEAGRLAAYARTDWDGFLNSTEKFISVFAGRGTGKTHNLALRAVRSRFDVTIFAGSYQKARVMRDAVLSATLSELSYAARPREGGNGFSIQTPDNRTIRIEGSNRVAGYRFDNEEVMFDEYDVPVFERMLRESWYTLGQAEHIVCVGSLSRDRSTYAQRWFNSSDAKFLIDSPYMHYDETYMIRTEMFPSESRLMLENLPRIELPIARTQLMW